MIWKMLKRACPAPQVNLMRAFNVTRGVELADRAIVADSSSTRRTGLLKHSGLEQGEGMWIAPCECVHTFGMRFPIDIVFISKTKHVVRAVENVGRRRIKAAWRAQSVLELPAGTIARTGTQAGDELRLQAAIDGLAEERPQVRRGRSGGEDRERKPAGTGRLRSCFGPFETTMAAVASMCIVVLAIVY